MEEALIDLLKGHAALTAIIGTSPARIYWMRAPQNTVRPYVVMQVISSIPDVAHSGPTGIIASRVQIDIYGDTYGAAKAVARAITGRLSGFRGLRLSITFDGIFKAGERDDFEDSASTDKLFRTSMDFFVWHKS